MTRPRPAAELDLTADPRPRNRPGLIAAAILYAACLLALAIVGIWG